MTYSFHVLVQLETVKQKTVTIEIPNLTFTQQITCR